MKPRWWAFFALAIFIRLGTVWISPVHELMHAALATLQGQEITEFRWDVVYIVGLNQATMTGAYFCEFLLYLSVVLISRPRGFTLWCFGVAHALILRAPVSGDFADFPTASVNFGILWVIGIGLGWLAVILRWRASDLDEQMQQSATIHPPLHR